VDLLPDLVSLEDDDLDELIRRLELEEETISLRRRMLHGHIDLLCNERDVRLRAAIDAGTAEQPDPLQVAEALVVHPTPDPDAEVGPELPPLPELGALADDALRARIRELEREEDEASLRRRVLHGQIDILKAERELRRRGHTGAHVDVERLSAILSERLLARPEAE
jgi:hypothetical protein